MSVSLHTVIGIEALRKAYVSNLYVFFQELSLNGSIDYLTNQMTEKHFLLYLVLVDELLLPLGLRDDCMCILNRNVKSN